MDTGSHLLFGATLAGLSFIDPVIAYNPDLAHAVLLGTLIGSYAPDLDAFARLKSYSAYIRLHRGVTHSIPALFLWPAFITVPLSFGFHTTVLWPHLFLWCFLAVFLHVFVDMFNSYGVQCFRPFTKQWIHLDILSLFEPFLFAIHVGGLILWLVVGGANVGISFAIIYLITIGFIVFRSIDHSLLVRKVLISLGEQGICHVLPSFHWFHWQFVLETEDRFITGNIIHRRVVIRDSYNKERENPVIQATMSTDGVRSFLQFAQRIHVSCQEKNDGYEVYWSDVRFWYNDKLPFGVEVQLDRNLKVISHKLGWRKKAWDPPFV